MVSDGLSPKTWHFNWVLSVEWEYSIQDEGIRHFMYEQRFRHQKECGIFEEDCKVCMAERLCFVKVKFVAGLCLIWFLFFKAIFVYVFPIQILLILRHPDSSLCILYISFLWYRSSLSLLKRKYFKRDFRV